MTQKPLEPARARILINEYRQVLQDVAALLPLGAPETLMPAGKDVLRAAIRREAQACSGPFGDPTHVETLREAYLSLASFLPYDEANAAARLHAACARGDLAFLSSPAAERTMARARQIEREATELARDFDALLTPGTDPLLAEVDRFLSEFQHKQSRPADA